MKTFIINIASRTDRWEEITAECERVGIADPERIEAVTGDNPMLAFNQSQHKALKAGIAAGEPFMVLEDDCVFTSYPWLANVPSAWDILVPGCNIIGMDTTIWPMPVRVNQDWFRLYNSWMTHCLIYSNQMAKWIDEHLDSTVMDGGNVIYDEWLRLNVYPHFNVYVSAEMTAYQRPSFSNIWNRETNYVGCFTQGNEYLANH